MRIDHVPRRRRVQLHQRRRVPTRRRPRRAKNVMRDGRRILDADAHVVAPGEVFGDAQTARPEPMALPPTTPFEAAGDTSKLADFFESGCAADAYLRCMDTEGIDAVVLYPSIRVYEPSLPTL